MTYKELKAAFHSNWHAAQLEEQNPWKMLAEEFFEHGYQNPGWDHCPQAENSIGKYLNYHGFLKDADTLSDVMFCSRWFEKGVAARELDDQGSSLTSPPPSFESPAT